jgi:hypothetical protein
MAHGTKTDAPPSRADEEASVLVPYYKEGVVVSTVSLLWVLFHTVLARRALPCRRKLRQLSMVSSARLRRRVSLRRLILRWRPKDLNLDPACALKQLDAVLAIINQRSVPLGFVPLGFPSLAAHIIQYAGNSDIVDDN